MSDMRNLAIRTIESTFPADAVGPITSDIGRKLLQRARDECTDWRHERIDILIRYAELCIDENERMNERARRTNGRQQ
jgi:hypothetical protein